MGKSALIVDDEPSIRQMLIDMLSILNFTVSEARDGVEALEYLQETQPDVVVLDIMMPRMDGLALTEKLRREPKTANLPIIILSAKMAVEEGLKAGADRYLCKPVFMNELLDNVQQITA